MYSSTVLFYTPVLTCTPFGINIHSSTEQTTNGVKTVEQLKVLVETRFFVKCQGCNEEHEVDTYEAGEIKCACGNEYEYDNGNPEKAEVV